MGCGSSKATVVPVVEVQPVAGTKPADAKTVSTAPPRHEGEGPYLIVDHKDLASDKIKFNKETKEKTVERAGLVKIAAGGDFDKYWQAKVAGRKTKEERATEPVLVIMYGTPGSGKSRAVKEVVKRLGWEESDFVHVDPDEMRYFSEEYRLCLSGAHAAQLPEVREKYGDSLRPAVWRSKVGGFTQEGFTVDVDGKPHFPVLAMAALRSQPFVRDHQLWGHKVLEMRDGNFVDRALLRGYHLVYDTMGNEPNKFLRELMRRARDLSGHQYRVVVCGCYAP